MKAVAMDTADDSTSQASEDQLVTLQIYVPELVVQKCMHFNKEELIWDVKNQILTSLPKELKEGFNYGLFCPPVNGRAGKFLDEERPLADYPFAESTGYVELRYKRRIYKMSMEEKQLRQIHSRANLRRLLEHVHNNHVDKITKMCSRGLDPNFHCSESGESPLTLSTSLKHPAKVIMALVNGGAHLDFRTKDGCTVLHKAVEKNNLEALRTLLDLGSSPNYKDSRGLTTLYYSVLHNSDPQLTEMLLHDHAMIGTSDPHGWQEIHQACKYGLVQHLEHLLFYGADMNARNASGNTPLHVCAVNDQESCARVLLFRGADKGALNYANQNPHQVAVIAGNLRLAEIIKNHREEDVVPYREAPRYNPRRRTSTANMGTLSHNHSDPRLEMTHSGKPPSPCPSNHSLPHLSTTSDTISQATEEDGEDGSQQNASSVTDAGDSSGAGANSSGTDSDPFDSAKSTPLLESVCVCIEDYTPSTSGHLQLCKGDIVEVIGVSGSGYLEGRRRDGDEGLFPAICVHEMPLKVSSDTLPSGGKFRTERRNMNFKSGDVPRKWKMFGEPRTVVLHKGKKGFGFILRGAKATSPLMERQPTEFWPSLQYLDDVDKGGVAEMAGLKKGDFLLEINGQDVSQASHEHVVAIIRQSGDLVSMTVVTVLQQPQMTLTPTEKPQLINRQCATLPRKLSTKKAPLPPKRDPKTTLSVGRARARSMVAGLAEIEVLDHTLNEYDSEGRSTKSSSIESIPNKPSSSATPESTPSTTTTTPVATTTTTPTSSQMPSSLLSRPSSRKISISELEDFFARHLSATDHPRGHIRNKFATKARIHRLPRKPSKRSKSAQQTDSDFRTPKNYTSTPELTTDLPSGAESESYNESLLKRSRSFGDVHYPLSRYSSRHHGAYHSQNHLRAVSDREHHKYHHRHERPLLRQHSIPETSKPCHQSDRKVRERSATPEMIAPSVIKQNGSDIYAETVPVNVKPIDKTLVPGRASCPPPSYPPPPPPVGQMIKVDVSRTSGEYANSTVGRQHHKPTAIMSSFRPTDSAKLYASPDAFTPVGYKKDHLQKCDVTLPRHMTKGTGLRSHSLPPKMPPGAKAGSNAAHAGGRSTTSLDADNSSGDSTTGYVPYKAAHRSRDQITTESGHQVERASGTLRKVKTAKLHVSAPDAASPKHYPALSQHPHEHFIQEPDYDSSEEEDRSSLMDTKGGLVTFKAPEFQNGSHEMSQEVKERPKTTRQKSDSSINIPSEQISTDCNNKALKHQTSFDAIDMKTVSGEPERIQTIQTALKTDQPSGIDNGEYRKNLKNAEGDITDRQLSGGNEAERQDTKVPISRESTPPSEAESPRAVVVCTNDQSSVGSSQVKTPKVAPVPPPKRTDENTLAKVLELDTNLERKLEAKSESPEKVDKDPHAKRLSDKETSQQETVGKNKVKESVPFKATIILKQTEIISKEKHGKSRNKELTHQHSAHELIQNLEKTVVKAKEEIRDLTGKDAQTKDRSVESPSQLHKDIIKDTRQISKAQEESQLKESFREFVRSVDGSPKEKTDGTTQKIAPAVPKKPKVDDVKQTEEISEMTDSIKLLTLEANNGDQEISSAGVDSASRSVKENIYNFEKRSELAAKTTFSPRRKSDVIRITLVGSQHKTTDSKPEEKVSVFQTMKTSKSCPKTFDEDSDSGENGSSIIMSTGSFDPETQVTRFSAETPTTAGPINSFPEEWKRPEVSTPLPVSPLTATSENAKKPPDTPPKTTIMRRVENFNRQSTLGRRPPSNLKETENGDTESPFFTGAMTLNRQSFTKSNQFPTTTVPLSTDSTRKIEQSQLISGFISSAPESGRKMASEQATEHARKKQADQHAITCAAESTRKTVAAELTTPTTEHARKIATEHMMTSLTDSSRKTTSEHVQISTDFPRKVATEQMMSSVDSSRKISDLMTPTSENARRMVNDMIMTSSAEHALKLSTAQMIGTTVDPSQKTAPEHMMSSSMEHTRKFADEQIANVVRMRDFEDSSYPEILAPRTSGPLSAQARLLDNRQVRVSPPTNRALIPPKTEDDECLRLCQRVDKSLQLIRLQVDSLGMAAASEPETLAELVPPPPEFNFAPPVLPMGNHPPPSMGSLHIAPPPEFSDETLARQRRHHQQVHALNALPQTTRMAAPPSTIDTPVSRRVVPPDGSSYPYGDHSYRTGYVQSPDSHPHLIPNNMSSSPVKTMTIARGYPSHHFVHQPVRYDSNCSTLPHPARMAAGHVRMEHPFSPVRATRDVPQRMMGPMQPPQPSHKEFRQKPLHQWSGKDVADWLESLFLPEYKICFAEAGITGSKLANMDNNDLMGLGVKQSGHRLNMERSIKWYLK